LAVQNDRLIVRGGATAMGSAITSLLVAWEQPLVLFLGAGASASARISVGDAMRSQALLDPLPSQSLTSYARAAQCASLDQTLSNRLVTETADTFLPALREHAISLPIL